MRKPTFSISEIKEAKEHVIKLKNISRSDTLKHKKMPQHAHSLARSISQKEKDCADHVHAIIWLNTARNEGEEQADLWIYGIGVFEAIMEVEATAKKVS